MFAYGLLQDENGSYWVNLFEREAAYEEIWLTAVGEKQIRLLLQIPLISKASGSGAKSICSGRMSIFLMVRQTWQSSAEFLSKYQSIRGTKSKDQVS